MGWGRGICSGLRTRGVVSWTRKEGVVGLGKRSVGGWAVGVGSRTANLDKVSPLTSNSISNSYLIRL